MKRAGLGLVLVLLAASAAAPQRAITPAPAPADYATRRAALQSASGFVLDGRLAAAVGQDGFNATLHWQQRGGRSDLQLRAPLGFGTARVQRDGTRVSLASSRGDHFEGDAALEELSRRLGFAAPLDHLRYWVLGVPDPAVPATEVGADGAALQALEQEGWRVEFQDYTRFGTGALEALLPRRLTLMRDAVRVRLLVEQWSVAP